MISNTICATGIASPTSGSAARRPEAAGRWHGTTPTATGRTSAVLTAMAAAVGADLSARRRDAAMAARLDGYRFAGTSLSTRLVVSTDLIGPPV